MKIEQDKYLRSFVRDMKPDDKICLPTPWGYYGLEVDSAGALTVYMSTDSGRMRRILVQPEVSNVVRILPSEA